MSIVSRAVFVLVATVLSVLVQAGEYASVLDDDRGAVATVNPLATKAAMEAFNQGGNAVDAALAAAFTLGVVDSHNSGIGGGCFILVHWADGRIEAIDGREMAPAAAHRDMYVRDGTYRPELSKVGPLAVGVPGSVAALHRLQVGGGELTWSDALLPAAQLAERGFPVDKALANRLQRTQEALQRFPASADIFLDKDGEPLAAGDVLVQKDLAHTYRKLAKQGPAYFYRGEFARAVGKWMQDNGGIVTAEDFTRYEVKSRQPVVSSFRGYRVYGFPPPSSGGTHVAQILNILEHFPLEELSDADRYHVIAEAMKLAFADRAFWLGDSDYVDVPLGLVDTGYARKLAAKVEMDEALHGVAHGEPPLSAEALFGKHTTHIATADRRGNWVAITTTLNTSFGSKITVPGTGVLLNNQMDDFAAQPGVPNAYGLVGAEANSVAPGKRPLSSMSPTIVLDTQGRPVLSAGAAGGPTIITQVAQALLYALAFDKPLPEAVAAPRVHHQWKPDALYVEAAVSEAVRESLRERGHTLRDLGPFGATQAIGREGKTFTAVTEPRLKERND